MCAWDEEEQRAKSTCPAFGLGAALQLQDSQASTLLDASPPVIWFESLISSVMTLSRWWLLLGPGDRVDSGDCCVAAIPPMRYLSRTVCGVPYTGGTVVSTI